MSIYDIVLSSQYFHNPPPAIHPHPVSGFQALGGVSTIHHGGDAWLASENPFP